ncbi:hypothetical protein PENSPDRAFT_756008 [Peniophora sp. CONT]|nr:hypothetical protein PENSPDRAFT_756008 [Peniophora sp. CONT]
MDTARQRAAAREACTSFLQSRFSVHERGQRYRNADERMSLADIELDVWEEMLVLARRQRNKARGACSLPPEILTSVFLFLRDDWEPQKTSYSETASSAGGAEVVAHTEYSLGWITVLAVCHSWRQVALSAPSLWTRISCSGVHPQYIPVMLARSRGLPLVLDAHGDPENSETYVPLPSVGVWLCRSVLLRTQNLYLDGLPTAYLTQLLTALCHSTPMLVDFRVDHAYEEGSRGLPRIPENVFDQRAPKLQRVQLQDVIFPWNTVSFVNTLVELRLAYTDHSLTEGLDRSYAPTAQQFHDVISSMNALKMLSLIRVFPLAADDSYSYTITLPPGFEELLLSASEHLITSCVDLFGRMTIPKHTRVTMNLTPFVDDEDLDNIYSIPATMRHLFGPVETTAPLGLYLTQKSLYTSYADQPQRDILTSEIPSSRDKWSLFDDSPRICGGRGLYVSYPGSSINETLLAHLSSLPLRKVRSIICATDAANLFTSPDSWIVHFAQSRDVQNVSIPYDAALPFIEALHETALNANDTGCTLLFPALRTIAFHVDPEFEGHFTDALHVRRRNLNVALVDMLHCRRQAETPLELLLVDEKLSHWRVWDRAKELVRVDSFSCQSK